MVVVASEVIVSIFFLSVFSAVESSPSCCHYRHESTTDVSLVDSCLVLIGKVVKGF